MNDNARMSNPELFSNYNIEEDNCDEEREELKKFRGLPSEEAKVLDKQIGHQRFPVKLWMLASHEPFKSISWTRNGKKIIIDEFTLEPLLGNFFRSKKYTSFLRQLHLYGFRKCSRTRNTRSDWRGNSNKERDDYFSVYFCEYFSKDSFDDLKNVRRTYAKSPEEIRLQESSPIRGRSQVISTPPYSTRRKNSSPYSRAHVNKTVSSLSNSFSPSSSPLSPIAPVSISPNYNICNSLVNPARTSTNSFFPGTDARQQTKMVQDTLFKDQVKKKGNEEENQYNYFLDTVKKEPENGNDDCRLNHTYNLRSHLSSPLMNFDAEFRQGRRNGMGSPTSNFYPLPISQGSKVVVYRNEWPLSKARLSNPRLEVIQ